MASRAAASNRGGSHFCVRRGTKQRRNNMSIPVVSQAGVTASEIELGWYRVDFGERCVQMLPRLHQTAHGNHGDKSQSPSPVRGSIGGGSTGAINRQAQT